MLALLWNYLKGYVIIRVYGFSVERFINLISVRNMYVWDVCSSGASAVMKIRLSGIDEARRCALRTGCEIEIIGEKGIPVVIRRFSKRYILVFGAVFFAIAFYGMSLFVWSVSILGNERVAAEEVAEFCEEQGLYPGGLKYRIDPKEISEGLVESFGDILWAAVEIDGTKAYVRIVETIEEPDMVDRETPVDLVAKKDGVIISVTASSGTPEVRAGDVVAEGDMLISSEMPIKNGEEIKGYEYVAAQGSVMAKVTYSLTSYIDLELKEKVFTGEKFEDTALILGNSTFNVMKPSLDGKEFDTLVSEGVMLKIGDYALPLGIKKYEYRVYYENERKLTEDEAKAALEADINKKIDELTEVGAVVLECIDEYSPEGNGIRLNSKVSVSEEIASKEFNIRRSASGGNEGETAGN